MQLLTFYFNSTCPLLIFISTTILLIKVLATWMRCKLTKKIKDTDAPSSCEYLLLLKKQSLKVCKPRGCWCRRGCGGIPKLIVLTILDVCMLGVEGIHGHPQAYGFHQFLDGSQFAVPSISVKKIQHKNSPILFLRGDVRGKKIISKLLSRPK